MNKTLALLGALLFVSACSSSTTDSDAGTTTGGGTGGTTGSSTSGTTTGSPMPVAQLRVGDFSPNQKPFDYCLALNGTQNYIGPVMSGRSGYGGLTFPSLADYVSLNPGNYDVVFVPPGNLTCEVPLSDAGFPPTLTNQSLAGSMSYTVAVMGLSGSLKISPFTDDTSTTAPASLRFLSTDIASPGLDMTANGVATFSNVTPGTVPSMTSTIDANGYASLANSGTFSLSFAVHGSSSPLLVAPGVTFTGGSYNSVFTIPPPTGYPGTLSAFVCFDSDQPLGGMTSCLTYPLP